MEIGLKTAKIWVMMKLNITIVFAILLSSEVSKIFIFEFD